MTLSVKRPSKGLNTRNTQVKHEALSLTIQTFMANVKGFCRQTSGCLFVLGFNATLTAKVISWRSVTHMCFLSWLFHTNTNKTFFPKPRKTFLTCFSRGESRKYAGKKVRFNRVSNLQPLGHESDTLTTDLPGRDDRQTNKQSGKIYIPSIYQCRGMHYKRAKMALRQSTCS